VLPEEGIITGGLAGDGPDFRATFVGGDGPPSEGLAVAVGLHGEAVRVGWGSYGGWERFGPERIISRSSANVLYELNGEPALALYKRYLGEEADKLPGSALLFPLTVRPPQSPDAALVRTIVGVDEAAQLLWPIGALAALSGGAILFKLLSKGGSNATGGFAGLSVQLAAAALAMVGPAWAFEGGLSAIDATPVFWASLLFQVIPASVAAYWIWFRLLHVCSATAASAWHFLMPPLGLLCGWLLLEEKVLWVDLAGIVPVAVGIALVTRVKPVKDQ